MNPLGMVHIMLFPKVSTINALRVSSMVLFFLRGMHVVHADRSPAKNSRLVKCLTSFGLQVTCFWDHKNVLKGGLREILDTSLAGSSKFSQIPRGNIPLQ